MSDELWARVEPILDRILELPEEQWDQAIEDATTGDPPLRAEVERMLTGVAASEGMLETPPPFVGRDLVESLPELVQGSEVGPYRVLEPLGRGGMGVVFLAERSDGSFEKQVALKVIQRHVVNEDTLQRFEEERRLLARLDHPNIAGILDGGLTEEGLPYFVMDLALGEAIDEHCDRLRLGLVDRVALFRTVCDAVQYAHGSLVVHRDLKPSNIVVDRSGDVRLLDFGIAKALDDRDLGAAPQTIGPTQRLTPEYAAPEQVTGEPMTAATDVYGLGMVLYRLLSGYAPYEIDDRSIAGIARAICFAEPKRPSERLGLDVEAQGHAERRGTTVPALRNALRGDLDAIILKALEKAPERRYGSVADFAADLRRYVEGRPIQARPHTTWYRLSKFVRRYRTQVAAASVAAAGLVGGVVATTVQWRAAVLERELREQEAERASLASGFLLTTLQDLAPERLGRPTLEPREVILLGMENLDDLQTTPRLRAGVMNTLGRLGLSLSEYQLADSLFRGALDVLATSGDPESALEQSESMTGLGFTYLRGTQDLEEAIPWFQSSLDLIRAELPPGDSLVVARMIDLGFALYAGDRFPTAATVLEEALDLDPPPGQRARGLDFLTNTRVATARELTARGRASEASSIVDGARDVGLAALALSDSLYGRRSAQVANTLMSLTELEIMAGSAGLAREYAAESLDIVLDIFGDRSSRTALAYGWVARAAVADGDDAVAEEAFQASITAHDRVAPAWTWRSRVGLAGVFLRQGRYPEAESLLISVADAVDDPGLEGQLEALSDLVGLYEQWGRPEAAEQYRTRIDQLQAEA